MWYNVFFTVKSDKPLTTIVDVAELLNNTEDPVIVDSFGVFGVEPVDTDT